MSTPFVSVIIPVWNSPRYIAKCLRALEAQTYPQNCFEIFVVDNGSTDNTREVAATFSKAKLLVEPGPGSYRARNLGLREAIGEYVIFTDADCVPDPDWIASAVRAAAATPKGGIYGGRVELFTDGKGSDQSCEDFERLYAFDQETNIRRGVCVTANWMSRRDLMQQIGGFNTDLKSGGDMECSSRIKAAGHDLVYVPQMLVLHPVRASLADLIGKRRRVVGGEWASVKKRAKIFRLTLGTGMRLVRMTLRALGARQYSPWRRFKLICVVLVLAAAEVGERIRLLMGAEPRRA